MKTPKSMQLKSINTAIGFEKKHAIKPTEHTPVEIQGVVKAQSARHIQK